MQQLVQGNTARRQNAKMVRSLEFGVIELWVQIPAIPLRDSVTLGE